MKKHLMTLAVGALAVVALASCSEGGSGSAPKKRTLTDVKVGLICLHDNNSTYDKNFIDSVNNAVENAGLAEGQLIVRTGIDEDAGEVKNTIDELHQAGCRVIIADSFGHEAGMIQGAKAYTDTQFLHCTGTQAQTEDLPNYHNAFASIYQGRYLAGVAAGLKLQEMKAADPTVSSKLGYVGAYPYAEVKSGYTSWYLGVKSVVSDVTMTVRFTQSWYDPVAEKSAAETLISEGAVIVSQHADSMGAPNACEEHNVPNISYNGSTYNACPNTFVVSSRIDWTYCFEQLILATANQDAEYLAQKDYTGSMLDGSVKLTDVGSAAAARTQTYLDQVRAELLAGTRHVFDVNTFTVGGQAPSEDNCAPDKVWTYDYPEGTLFLKNGYYNESVYRSAPSFDVDIDGLTVIYPEA